MSFAGANILITGGAGFIGSALARHLIRDGARVTIADSFVPEYGGNMANIESILDAVHLSITDVRDQHAMNYLVQGKDFLFNLAGQTSHLDSMTDPFTDLEINVRAQLSILEACRKFSPEIKLVFAGTRQIYGKPDYLPVDEKHPIRPVDVNGINKLAGEWYHLLYNNVYGLRATVLRLTNTYGPCMRIKDARQTFVGVWIRNLLTGLPLEVWGGEQLRDFTYVDDCVEAMLLAATEEKANGLALNIGGTEPVSLKELAVMLTSLHGNGTYVIKEFPPERRKIDIGDYYSSDAQLRNILEWAPQISLREGLQRTLTYFSSCYEKYI
jgi:nucleoside-diphosphate-sugar epimerase